MGSTSGMGNEKVWKANFEKCPKFAQFTEQLSEDCQGDPNASVHGACSARFSHWAHVCTRVPVHVLTTSNASVATRIHTHTSVEEIQVAGK